MLRHFAIVSQPETQRNTQLPDLLTLLICPHQHRLLDDMPLHRLLDIGLAWFLQIRKDGIERVKLVEVAMAPDRWTRAAVTGALEITHTIQRSRGQFVR